MIEITKNSLDEYQFFAGGSLLRSAKVSLEKDINSGKEFFDIFIKDFKDVVNIVEYSLSEFPPLHVLNLEFELPWLKNGSYGDVWLMSQENGTENIKKVFEVSIVFHSSSTHWKAGYSFSEYYNELRKTITENDILSLEMNDKNGGLEYGFVISNRQSLLPIAPISISVNNFLRDIESIHKKVEENLGYPSAQSLFSIAFNFPLEVKSFCEQYLLYFAQFLQDLGIDTTSNLKEEAGKVLFSVTLTDDTEALDRIREALAVYLNLPSSPIVYDDSFAAMRLQQQIENLQHSQRMVVRELQFNEKLLIAQSQTIGEKNVTISQQQSVIEQQNKIIEKISSKSIMIDSAENKEELEELCDGLKIGKSKFLMEQLGVHLNPATVAKGIGRKILGKPEENSILDLNQEKEEKVER